jgi:hypothetical protein
LAGDADLDGDVDFNDLVKLTQNYNATAGKFWHPSDFNYDANVDFHDLVSLAQKYNSTLAGSVPSASAGFERDVARAFAEVPKPGMCARFAGASIPPDAPSALVLGGKCAAGEASGLGRSCSSKFSTTPRPSITGYFTIAVLRISVALTCDGQ